MKNLIAIILLAVSANAVPFNKKVDPSKLGKELVAAGCKVNGVTMEGTGRGDVSTNCSASVVAAAVAAHVYQDPALARAALIEELGALEDQIDAGTPFTAAQQLRFNKLILILTGLSKN